MSVTLDISALETEVRRLVLHAGARWTVLL